MKMNMKRWMFGLLNSMEREAMPIMTYPGLKLANESLTRVIRNGEAQYRCIEALSRKYASAAAVTVMDLSVEAEAFGSPVTFSDEDVPTVASRIVSDYDTVMELKVPKVGEGRTSAYIKAAELAAANIDGRPSFGGIIGPFSLAGRLFDMTEAMVATLLEPDTMHALLEKVTVFLIEYAKAFKQVGANGIVMAEPAAGLLSPEQCEEFSSGYVKRVVDEVQSEEFMVILHNCGNTTKLVSSMVSTGAMGLHFGNAVKMWDIMPQIPWGRIAFGNIDPAGLFKNGTAQEVYAGTSELLQKTANYKNFVLSSGCDIPPGTPIENISAFFEALEDFNREVMETAV